MSAESLDLKSNQSLNEAFPVVDPGVKPLGARVLIQLRRISKQSKGGIILVEETKDTAKWNNQVAKVVAVGPVVSSCTLAQPANTRAKANGSARALQR